MNAHIGRRLTVACTLLSASTALAQNGTNRTARDSAAADSAARLKAITIVAAPAERAEPVAATHVDAGAIRLTPSTTPYELLRQTTSLEVHEQGQGPGFASDAAIRGFSSDHSTDLALWIDGVPVNEPVNGHAEGYNDWSLLFPGGVQDIDVVRGPTSALFGNFALAGVVNVRTLERMRGSEVTASGGSFGRADAMLLTGFDHGARGGGVLGARVQRQDGFRPNARYDIEQGHARIVHDLGSGFRIDAGAELYGGNWNSPGYLGVAEFIARDYSIVSNASDGGYKRRAQERVSVRWLRGNMLWRTTTYATQGRWQLFLTIPPEGGRFEGSGSQTEEEDTRTGLGATTALTWSLPSGEFTVGGETRWDRSRYQNYFTTDRARDSVAEVLTARQALGAPFVQSHWNVTDRLRVDLGARYDLMATRSMPDGTPASSATHGIVSPKVGAMLRVTPRVGVYANASRGFRSADGIVADPALEPIVAWSYETGVKYDRNGLMASAAVFRMEVSNEETFNPLTLESFAGGGSRRQGLELDIRVPMDPRLTVIGDWTFNDARYRSLIAVPEDGGAPVTLDGLRVYNTSKYVGSAALDAGPARGAWRIRISGNWVGPYSPFDAPGELLGAYGLAHVAGTWNFRRVSLDAGVRNVFDRAYPEVVAGEIVSPGQPRSFVLSATARM